MLMDFAFPIDEAIELRQAGLNKKILILGVSELEAVSLAKEYDITLTVAGLEWIQALSRQGSRDLTELDCPTSRLTQEWDVGLEDSSEAGLAQDLLQQRALSVEGIFTHFATADEASDNHF